MGGLKTKVKSRRRPMRAAEIAIRPVSDRVSLLVDFGWTVITGGCMMGLEATAVLLNQHEGAGETATRSAVGSDVPGDVKGETLHAMLRRDSNPLHRAVEAALASYDLLEADGYRGFLLAQARAVLPIERALDEAGVIGIVPDWPDRRRSQALCEDLLCLGGAAPVDADHALAIGTPGQSLGALYVLEGSRLGGRLLAQRVAGSRDPSLREATSFLRHSAGPGKWKAFLTILNASPSPHGEVFDGARQAFEQFLAAAVHRRDSPIQTPRW